MPRSDLHRCVHHPARVAILVAVLKSSGAATFPVVRDEIGLSDGNLNRHLKVLLDEGWVTSRRTGLGRGSLTTLNLTGTGHRGLEAYRNWCLEVAGAIHSPVPLTPGAGRREAGPAGSGVIDDRSRGWVTESS